MIVANLYNLARMSTATTGTGTITLGSAVSGFLSFATAGVSNGETVTYAIKDGANSEIGRGVYTSSGTTLSRTVLKSTNSNAAISLSGSAEVFITAAAEDFGGLRLLNSGTVSNAADLQIVLTSFTAYRGFKVILSGLRPATDNVDLQLTFSTNGGSSYDSGASNYNYSGHAAYYGGIESFGSAADTKIVCNRTAASNNKLTNDTAKGGASFVFEFFNMTSTAFYSGVTWTGRHGVQNDAYRHVVGQGVRLAAQDTDAVRWAFSSGNIASCEWAIYGYS